MFCIQKGHRVERIVVKASIGVILRLSALCTICDIGIYKVTTFSMQEKEKTNL